MGSPMGFFAKYFCIENYQEIYQTWERLVNES